MGIVETGLRMEHFDDNKEESEKRRLRADDTRGRHGFGIMVNEKKDGEETELYEVSSSLSTTLDYVFNVSTFIH